MKLANLLEILPGAKIYGNRNVNFSSISEDSRTVKKGSLFVAIKGLTVDGNKFISQAIENGAAVVVGQIDKGKTKITKGVTYIKVDDSRKSLGLLASGFYGNPSQK